ncbi:hypothetical protein T11_16841 [Trichinella zimbabwensis]|uniref:Uncharacterized protein n=1 Tax=Trichinella zimbabwensis TaxID=268475 RepID=A0A0V1I1K8_9BILA|nr:hypothetical protein T11_16841 [Trichinella zimbabwensis]
MFHAQLWKEVRVVPRKGAGKSAVVPAYVQHTSALIIIISLKETAIINLAYQINMTGNISRLKSQCN